MTLSELCKEYKLSPSELSDHSGLSMATLKRRMENRSSQVEDVLQCLHALNSRKKEIDDIRKMADRALIKLKER